jgi:hypothetical protein
LIQLACEQLEQQDNNQHYLGLMDGATCLKMVFCGASCTKHCNAWDTVQSKHGDAPLKSCILVLRCHCDVNHRELNCNISKTSWFLYKGIKCNAIEGSLSGHLVGQNNRNFLLWEMKYILMQKYFIVPDQQDGRRENPVHKFL